MEWISVKDRFPDEKMRVLVYRPDMKNADVGPVSVQWGWMAQRNDVTHWAIIEPPKDG